MFCRSFFVRLGAVLGAAFLAIGVVFPASNSASAAAGQEAGAAAEGYAIHTASGAVLPVRPAAVWAACGVSDAETKLVRRFALGSGLPDGGPGWHISDLLCGTAGYGYRHIKDRHITDWENIAFMVGWNWRDMADFALEHGLDYPQRVDYRSGNDTFLYQGSFWIADSEGNVMAKYCSQTAIASQDGKIITSFPKSSTLPTGVC